MIPQPLNLLANPSSLLAAWPKDLPLACVWAGGAGEGARPPERRWTILGIAGEVLDTPDAASGQPWPAFMHAPGAPGDPDTPPLPAHIGWIAYDVGRALEPKASSPGARADRPVRGLLFRRVEEGLAFDHATGRWWAAGERARRLAYGVDARAIGPGGFWLGGVASGMGQAAFASAVARAIEYIRAGDVYEVNLAHRLSGPFAGSARGIFAGMCALARSWHGVHVEGPGIAVASASPELFLHFDPVTRVLRSRPMKGTRPAGAPGAHDDLERSVKDRAELAMIVDLMRNDLGRVCALGGVRVESPRRIERHDAGVLQATACVEGTLRTGLTLGDALGATFPPGSVTGAPKIRAMQIIDELEPVRRGVYCGSAGYIGDDGRAMLNVAIRTAVITGRPARLPGEFEGGTLDYSVGAGIVADSDPQGEWRETLDKAGVLDRLTGLATPPRG